MTTTGIKLTLDVGDAVSAAGRYSGALHKILEDEKKLHELAKKENTPEAWGNYGKAVRTRETMQNSNNAFNKTLNAVTNSQKFITQGPNGQTIFKADQEFVSMMKNHVDATKKLTDALNAAAPGSEEALNLAYQLENQQKAFSKAIENATGTGAGAKNNGAGEAVKSIALNQIVGAIKNGMDVWVSSTDRTAVINSAGSGNMLGASLAERQRRTNMTTGALDTTGAAAQGIGLALAPFTGGISLIAGTGINLLTSIAGSLSKAEQARYANRIAYSSLWDDKKEQAMNLAALLGDPSNVRGKWGEAAGIAERYGFSAEEGAESLIAAARQGLGGDAVRQVLDAERRTGADRGVLSSVSYLSGRYGGGDALRAGWQGLNASKMQTAQFGEFLRSMERVMSDGIQRGFKKSSDEAARDLTMLSQMTGYNPLWTGEQGANRLMQMNSGLDSAKGLTDSTEIMMFKATRESLAEKMGISSGEVSIVDVLERMEQGMDADIARRFRDIAIAHDGADNELDLVTRFSSKLFNGSITQARTFLKGIPNMATDTQYNAMLQNQRGMPEAGEEIAELKASIDTMHVRNLIIEAGQGIWNSEIRKAIEETNKQYTETVGALTSGGHYGNSDDPPPMIGMPTVSYTPRMRTQEIDSWTTTVPRTYFGRGGNGQQDRAAQRGMEDIFDRARFSGNDDQLQAAFDSLNILNTMPRAVRERWDNEDKLNPLANSGNAVDLLAALRRLIEIEENNGDAIRGLAEMNIVVTD